MSTKRRVMVTDSIGRESEARFHQFETVLNGLGGNRIVAIVEWDSGRVAWPDINDIRFLDSEVQHEQS